MSRGLRVAEEWCLCQSANKLDQQHTFSHVLPRVAQCIDGKHPFAARRLWGNEASDGKLSAGTWGHIEKVASIRRTRI